jgi:hypothetical protein
MGNAVTYIRQTQHEDNKLHSSLVALLRAAPGALLQIGGECYDVAPYIVYLPESFFHILTYSSLFQSHHNRSEDDAAIDYR